MEKWEFSKRLIDRKDKRYYDWIVLLVDFVLNTLTILGVMVHDG
ncbi:hypothetical protein [Halalkalibacter alkaliphilus]|nr:hypothetical protein [Halalkalibacter alkaliphilus]